MKKLIALIFAMVMVSGLAYADDQWNFYGSARVNTFWNTIDDQAAVATADTDAFTQSLQSNARIGATVKVSDEVGGGFEYGTGVNVRKLYGTWNFGSGSLMVGQNYSPLCFFMSNSVYNEDNDLFFYGGVYSGREAMLQVTMGGLKVALVPTRSATPATWTSNEVKMPGIEASYTMKMDAATLILGGGYQSFEATNATGTDDDVVSYVVALGGTVNLGAAYIKANAYTGQNAGYILDIRSSGTAAGLGTASTMGLATVNATEVLDSDTTGYLVVVGAKVNDMIGLEAGYSNVSTDSGVIGAADDDATAYYAQATITLAPGVTVTPEIGVLDFEEVGQKKETYFGAKWMINF